jgi:mannose-1-phosphate guanylyltransferase
MAAIAGRPFLEYLLLHVREHGYREVVLCTGYMGESIERYFEDGRKWSVSLRYSHEPEPRGTAGALKLAQPLLGGDRWLVMNGDSFFDVPLKRLARVHVAVGALATLALARVPDVRRYGRVELGQATEITRFLEKGETSEAGLVNGGIYVLERRLLDTVPVSKAVSLEREVFPRIVGQGLHGLALDGAFVDIGVPQEYLRLRHDPGPLARLLA